MRRNLEEKIPEMEARSQGKAGIPGGPQGRFWLISLPLSDVHPSAADITQTSEAKGTIQGGMALPAYNLSLPKIK